MLDHWHAEGSVLPRNTQAHGVFVLICDMYLMIYVLDDICT